VEFTITSRSPDCTARCGTLRLAHGTIRTPAFSPVATRGSVRGILPAQLLSCGTQIVLANAYHLALSPGAREVAALGGLHRLMGWTGPIITDSGGYQVFSLTPLRRITEDGVEFRSPLDGSTMMLGPREATRIQNLLGSDIAMAFDECPPCPCERKVAEAAVERTLRWADVCLRAHEREDQVLFGIVQGGTHEDLRARCAEGVVGMGFEGYAIGGVSVGEGEELRREVVRMVTPMLPPERPRHLLGVGFPSDVLEAIQSGIDLFDCVAPTRMGRNGTAFTALGRLRLRNSSCRTDPRPIEEGCDCPACRLYSRAYVNHLLRCREMLGPILLALHNLRFYHRMMQGAREAIGAGRYVAFKEEFLSAQTGR